MIPVQVELVIVAAVGDPPFNSIFHAEIILSAAFLQAEISRARQFDQ
jgi:hypothetical protein